MIHWIFTQGGARFASLALGYNLSGLQPEPDKRIAPRKLVRQRFALASLF